MLFSTPAFGQHVPNNKLRASAWNFMILLQNGGAAPGEARIRNNWTAPFDVLSDTPQAGDVWAIDFAIAESQRGVGPFTDTGTNEGNPVWFTADSAIDAGWQPFNATEDGINYDDFAGRNAADRDNIMGIATTYVENTTADDIQVTVCTCSDDSLLVNVNQNEVAIVNRGRGWCGGAQECQEQNCAILKPGINQVTIQVWEGGGGWNFRLGLLDSAGQPITDNNNQGIIYLGPGEGELEGSDEDSRCRRAGCTNPAASNFDPAATEDDGSCVWAIVGPWLNTEQWNHLLLENGAGCGPGDQSLEGNWTYPYLMADEDPTHGDEWEIDFANAQASGWGGTRIGCVPRWMTREGALADNPAIDLPIRGDGLMDMNDWCNRIGARNDNAMWIGTTYINNTNDVPVAVDVCTASDDSVRVDINNYIVTRVNACRGSAGDCQETRPGELAPGVNKITAYVYEGGGGFNGRFRLTVHCAEEAGCGATLEEAGIQLLGPGDGDFEGAFLNARPARSHGVQWEPDVIVDPGENGEVGASGINPNGWIQTDAWNLLVPVGNPHGCGGGGVGVMAQSWTGDFLIEDEDPQDGDEWDIDWSMTPANGFPGQTNNPEDIAVWRTTRSISDGLADVDCGDGAGPSQFNGDLVDFQAICVATGTPNDNVMAIATTYVENLTGEDLPIQVCTSSDDSVACYVNDELRQNISACRGSGGDCQERADAVLVPGVNKLALLVWEGGGGFNMRFAIEANGGKLTDNSVEVDFLGASYDAGPPEICGNQLDDDGDGAVDCEDSDCPACPEICDDGIDNDGDGVADCDDDDCADDAGCQVAKGPTFVRGDANSDGSVNLTDGVVPLLYLFSGGAAPACLDSADTNDTGGIEITDAIIIFGWLFTGGLAPAEPAPLSPGYSRAECAVDPTEDGIGCDRPSPTCQ